MNTDMVWRPRRLASYEWLRPLLSVPDDAAPPLAMSRPPRDAVGSYGADAIAWIEKTQNIKLRWWQALAITRQLEHRKDGSLCHRVVLESAPRRAGKSVRVRGVALWRMAHPELFGEVQTVIHTGSDVAICREIQRGAWRWSEEVAGWTVSRSNGKEAVETPTGDRWLVRAQQAVYGYDCCFGIVDEGWNVSPDTVSEGLEPATLERLSPQLHLTSTAHRRATSLMRSRLRVALAGEAGDTLLLLWAAPSDADPSSPAVWRAASPYWSKDRHKLIADRYAKALAGEADPQADDPDPMAGFTAQYLNIWPQQEVPDPAFDAVAYTACFVDGEIGFDDLRGRLALCFDLAPSLQHATLYAASVQRGGRTRIGLVEQWAGPGCADQAARELPAIVARIKPRAFGVLPGGPGAAVMSKLGAERLAGWPASVPREEIRGHLPAVVLGFASLIEARQLVRGVEPLLDGQVAQAEKLPRGDAWVVSRKGKGDCDAVYAAAGAAHLAQQLPASLGKVRVLTAAGRSRNRA